MKLPLQRSVTRFPQASSLLLQLCNPVDKQTRDTSDNPFIYATDQEMPQ